LTCKGSVRARGSRSPASTKDPATLISEPTTDPSYSAARPIVLVADDDEAIRALFSAVLTTAGFEVVEAVDGEDALARLATMDVSLVLLDTTMPRLDGLEVVRRLRANERTSRLPIVLVSGAAAESDRVRGLDLGADDYLAKPVSTTELVARARAHVRAFDSWRQTVRRSLEIRRSVSTLLRRMPREGSPAQTAARAIAELRDLIGIDAIALLQPRAGRYSCYAAHGELTATYPPGSILGSALSVRLGSRAAEGYWVQPLAKRPGHAVAYFPFEVAGGKPGLLVVADRAEGPMARRVLNRLADLAEVAELVGGFLAPIADQGAAEVELRRRVEGVIESQAFLTHFQPIVRLDDRTVVGFEALTRFADGVSPEVRFADAQRTGLGPELELATLAAAIQASEHLPGDPKLHVNISPARLLDTDRLPALIDRSRRRLVIELTEHEAIGDYAELNAAISALGDKIEIAVDDAGSGYASLRHIQALRPHAVKLDLEWVHAVDGDPAIQALVSGLVQFGRRMGCAIIGEGVQTKGQHAALMALGVDFGQGYRFGKPAPVERWRGNADPVGSSRVSRSV
jgi:EAL domain-containing protein (putative c-di-GMP-specific phosphodiesterase class I)/FixJ family two-component response regulator